MALSKTDRRTRIRRRIRKKLSGTAESPRLAVFRSNKQIYVQVIDDNAGKTLVSASSKEKSVAAKDELKKIDQAAMVGKLLAEKCKERGIERLFSTEVDISIMEELNHWLMLPAKAD